MLYKLMDSNVVILSFGLSLLNQTFTHHPSLLSLSLPHGMAAGWPIQGVSYRIHICGCQRPKTEHPGVSREECREHLRRDIPSPLYEMYTNKLEPLLSHGGMLRQTF